MYENQRTYNKRIILQFGKGKGFFFRSSHTGKFISRHYLRRRLAAAAEAGLGKDNASGVTPHALRRSIASLLVDKNIPLDAVAGLLRNNVGTLLKHYNKANDAQFTTKFSEVVID